MFQERKLNLVNLKSKKEVHEVGLAKLRQREKEILEQNQVSFIIHNSLNIANFFENSKFHLYYVKSLQKVVS